MSINPFIISKFVHSISNEVGIKYNNSDDIILIKNKLYLTDDYICIKTNNLVARLCSYNNTIKLYNTYLCIGEVEYSSLQDFIIKERNYKFKKVLSK